MQVYYADRTRPADINGSTVHCSKYVQAGSNVAKVSNCPCDDGKRRTVYVTGGADTYFSIPAACLVAGKRRVGYLTGTEGGFQFRFMNSALADMNAARVDLNPVSGNPMSWRLYAVSYGNGNEGLSRMWPDFKVWADPDTLYEIARLAMVTRGFASKAWVRRNVQVDEVGPDAVQAVLYDPPGRDGAGWSEHNGAWQLCEVYPADETFEASEAPSYETPLAAFGPIARAAGL